MDRTRRGVRIRRAHADGLGRGEGFGNDSTEGVLVASSADEIAIRRTDERAGEVVVHVPREHSLVEPI